jgi:hypothetical protein
MCGMIAKAIISGANLIPSAIEDRRYERDRASPLRARSEDRRLGAACERGQATPHAGTFARTGQ